VSAAEQQAILPAKTHEKTRALLLACGGSLALTVKFVDRKAHKIKEYQNGTPFLNRSKKLCQRIE